MKNMTNENNIHDQKKNVDNMTHITSYLARNLCHVIHSFFLVVDIIFIGHILHSFILVVDIICIGQITSYLVCNVSNSSPIFHIY